MRKLLQLPRACACGGVWYVRGSRSWYFFFLWPIDPSSKAPKRAHPSAVCAAPVEGSKGFLMQEIRCIFCVKFLHSLSSEHWPWEYVSESSKGVRDWWTVHYTFKLKYRAIGQLALVCETHLGAIPAFYKKKMYCNLWFYVKFVEILEDFQNGLKNCWKILDEFWVNFGDHRVQLIKILSEILMKFNQK